MARGEVRYRLALETKAFTDGIKAAKQEAASLGNDLAGKLGKAGNILSAMGPAGMVAAAGIGAATVAVGAVTAAVVSAAKAAADYADNLAALETKTGLSTDALQQMEIAAKLGNSSIESLAAATNKMQKGIVDGNENFKKLGLNLADLRRMTPEEQLKATAKAIEGIRDPAQKTAAAMAIFGKSGTDVIGSLKSLADGSSEMAGALDGKAVKASAAMADQLDLMGVAMDRAWRQFGAAVAGSPEVQAAIGDITKAFVALAEWLREIAPEIQAFITTMSVGITQLAADVKASFAVMADGAKVLTEILRFLFAGVSSGAAAAAAGIQQLSDRMPRMLGALSPALGMLGQLGSVGSFYGQQRAAARRGAGVSSGGVTVSGGPKFSGAADDAAAKAAAAAAERARAAWQKGAEDARKEWDKFYAEFEKRGREAVWGMEDDLKKRVKAMAPTGNEPDGPIAKLKAYNDMVKAVSEDAKKVDAYEAEHSLRADERLLRKIDLVGQLGASFQDLGAIVGGVFGGIIGGLGNITQGIGSAMASIRQMKTAGGGLGGMLGKASGALGLAGAAFSIGKTIFGGIKSFFGGKSDEEKAAEKQKIEDTTKQLDDLKKKIDSIRLEKLSAGVTGLASLFRHMVGQAALTPEAIDRINVKMGKYKEKLKDLTLTEDEYKKKIKERRQELESAAEGADVEQMKQRMERLGIIGTAMFQALKKEGKSTVEAMREMGPAIDQAIAAAQAHGIEIGGTLGMLADFRQKVGANEDLVSAAEGLGSVMDALRATGSLTQETFNALQGELGTVFADLTAKGFTADQALALLAPTLLQIRDAAKEGKIAVDEQTAALIRQAEAGGHFDGVKDPMKEMVELQKMMLELWAAIAQMQGVTLPDSLRAYIATLREASAAAAGVGVPGTAPVDAHLEGHSGPDGSTQSAGGFWNPSMPHGPLAGGGTNLVVHPGEEVSVTPRGRRGGGMGNVVLNVDGRAFARVQNNNTRKNRGGARSQGQRFIGSR